MAFKLFKHIPISKNMSTTHLHFFIITNIYYYIYKSYVF